MASFQYHGPREMLLLHDGFLPRRYSPVLRQLFASESGYAVKSGLPSTPEQLAADYLNSSALSKLTTLDTNRPLPMRFAALHTWVVAPPYAKWSSLASLQSFTSSSSHRRPTNYRIFIHSSPVGIDDNLGLWSEGIQNLEMTGGWTNEAELPRLADDLDPLLGILGRAHGKSLADVDLIIREASPNCHLRSRFWQRSG